MNKKIHFFLCYILVIMLSYVPAETLSAQDFDFERLYKRASEFIVIAEMEMEVSFGIQTNAQKQRMMGTIVTEEGLFIFDGAFLSNDNLFSVVSGLTIKTTPTTLTVKTLSGEEYEAEYAGVDRFTQLGFARIVGDDLPIFKPISFVRDYIFEIGSWVALFNMLPEFVSPPLGADIGLISSLLTEPENFPLTVGFGPSEVSSVLFDSELKAVGILGNLMDPRQSNSDASGMLESFGESNIPMFGIITAERIEKLIADPPQKGKIDRAWLGISLQALTPDIAEFLGFDVNGGIIVNDVIPRSPAFNSGLQIGDVIYEVNGQPILVNDEDKVALFQRQIAEMGPATRVEFSVFRPADSSTDSLTILATLDAAPIAAADAPELKSIALDLTVRDLVFADFMAYDLDQETFTGVAVSELDLGGLASIGGLRIGDIIQKIDSRPVSSVEVSKEIFDKFEEEKPSEIIFFVFRSNKTLFVNVKTDWE